MLCYMVIYNYKDWAYKYSVSLTVLLYILSLLNPQVTSRYAKAPSAAFAMSARFKANYMTF